VVVGEDASVQQDFVLTELPNTLVTGVVYDDGIEEGSYHGYPLYAKLTFSMTGYSEPVYTDPMTGEYEIVLYSGQEYNVNVQALVPGYEVLETTITPDDVEVYVQDYYLNIDNVACSAPGYQPEYDIMFDFEAGDSRFRCQRHQYKLGSRYPYQWSWRSPQWQLRHRYQPDWQLQCQRVELHDIPAD